MRGGRPLFIKVRKINGLLIQNLEPDIDRCFHEGSNVDLIMTRKRNIGRIIKSPYFFPKNKHESP